MEKVAVVGAGHWGKNLVRNFNALGPLGAICDNDPQVLAKFNDIHPQVPCVLSCDQLLNDEFPVGGVKQDERGY